MKIFPFRFFISKRQNLLLCPFRSISVVSKTEPMSERIRQKRNDLFTKEKERQLKWIARIEKIEVDVLGGTADDKNDDESLCKLAMNKDLSTPYNCALRKSRF